MVAAWDIYAQQLMHLGHGHALWGPEPCPDFGEIHLGDVGYIQDGYFFVLFNSMQSEDGPVNSKKGVPFGFTVFDPPSGTVMRRPNHITQTQLHSKSIQSVLLSSTASAGAIASPASASLGLRYECSEESGALLMLKQPAHKIFLNCKAHIRKYIRTHITNWCDFANDRLGIGLQEKDIIFVSGTTKTSIWAEAAFHNSNSRGELVIAGGCFVPSVSGEFRASMSRCTDASVSSRAGPYDRVCGWKGDVDPPPEDLKSDQCIFINYYKIKRRSLFGGFPSVMRAAAGPHQLPDADSDHEEPWAVSVSGHSDQYSDEDLPDTNPYDPVGSLLEYMLEYSDADVVCASDDDLKGLVGVTAALQDEQGASLVFGIPHVVLDEEGVGILVRSDAPIGCPIPGGQALSTPLPTAEPINEACLDDRSSWLNLRSSITGGCSKLTVFHPLIALHSSSAASLPNTCPSHLSPPSHISDVSSSKQVTSIRRSVNDDGEKSHSVSASLPVIPRTQPRRRDASEMLLYKCNWPNCTKTYATINHLNAHVVMQRHGPKRSPHEFKELRRQRRARKAWQRREADGDRERAHNALQKTVSTEGSFPATEGSTSKTGASSDRMISAHASSFTARRGRSATPDLHWTSDDGRIPGASDRRSASPFPQSH